MAEYISKEFMLKILEADNTNNAEHCLPVTVQIMERFIRYVKEFPAVDVQPVKRGRWELTDNPSFRKCSECGAWWSSDITDNCFTKYCPKCGARMDGDTNG